MAQVLEHLPRKHKTLSSMPSTSKKLKGEEGEEKTDKYETKCRSQSEIQHRLSQWVQGVSTSLLEDLNSDGNFLFWPLLFKVTRK
jgi:hypothetical protein